MERPPQGMKCVDCTCCQADVYANGEPICWACDAGEPCEGFKRRTAKPEPKPAAPAKTAPVPKEKPVAITSTRRTNTSRISDEIRAKIIAADPSVSNVELARRYGVSDPSASTIRRDAGIKLIRRARKKPGPKAKKSARSGRSKDFLDLPPARIPKAADVVFPQPETEVVGVVSSVSIHLTFSPDQLDMIWQKFSLESKAIAITAGLQSTV